MAHSKVTPLLNRTEEWRSVSGYENLYEVSSMGRVRSLDHVVIDSFQGGERRRVMKGRLLRLATGKTGYLTVMLYKQGKGRRRIVHRMVAQAFIPNPDGLPEVNHINNDRKDNRVINLEWATRQHNILHGMMVGEINPIGEESRLAKLTNSDVRKIRKMLERGSRQREIAERFGVSQSAISVINTRKKWAHVQ